MMDVKKRAKKYKNKILEYFADPIVNVPMKLNFVGAIGTLFIFKIKFVPGTSESKIKKHLGVARRSFKLELFQLHRDGYDLLFIASEYADFDNRLLGILTSPAYPEVTKGMAVPYPIGFNVMRRPIIIDLIVYGHWLIGGGNLSGKTTGFQALIASIIWSRSPEDVNLIIIDGVAKLGQFDGLPHLCCDVIQDNDVGYLAVMSLFSEMQRRLKLKDENAEEFSRLPYIICFIDECVSFVPDMGNKEKSKSLAGTISLLLRKARHAKIHLLLATQNSAVEEMMCDLRPITSRISFKVGKPQDSTTLLGEGGAEQLLGKGEMYFKSQQHTDLMYMKGAYITDDEIDAVCSHIRTKYEEAGWDDSYKFVIDTDNFHQFADDADVEYTTGPVITQQDIDNRTFAEIIMWSLSRKTVSGNAIDKAFDTIGARKASSFLEMLHKFGIAGEAVGKLGRRVIPTCYDDLLSDAVAYLKRYGYTAQDIKKVFDGGYGMREDTATTETTNMMPQTR